MTIDSIQNGYVLDHIPAGMGMRIYKLLGLDKTDAQVALIQNAKSSKMGKKDVLKIATDKFDLNLDVVAYLAPHTTVNVICGGKAAEKQDWFFIINRLCFERQKTTKCAVMRPQACGKPCGKLFSSHLSTTIVTPSSPSP